MNRLLNFLVYHSSNNLPPHKMGLVSDKISSIEGRIDANIEKFQSDNNVQASETFEYAIFASIGGYVYKLSLLIIETM